MITAYSIILLFSIAVIKRYSEHLWSPGNKKKIKLKDVVKDGVESQAEGKGSCSEASSTSKPGSNEVISVGYWAVQLVRSKVCIAAVHAPFIFQYNR